VVKLIKNPIELLNPNCFDIGAKIGFAWRYLNNIQDPWGEQMYLHHLKVWNGLHELNPHRKGAQAYLDNFKHILDSVKAKTFDFEKSPIPVNSQGKLINGRHRLAAAIMQGCPVMVKEMPDSAGQEVCDYQYLVSKKDTHPAGLDPDFSNEMAIEYAAVSGQCYIATVFFQHNPEDILRVLRQFGRPVYWRQIPLERDAAFNLMRELYWGEEWLRDWHSSFSGAREKAQLALSSSNSIGVYMFECNNLNLVIECKRTLRRLFKGSQHSLHINDTQLQTWATSRILFNKSSIHFLNRSHFQKYSRFEGLFGQFNKYMAGFKGMYCVDGSAVMSAYGLRECQDLDYLDKNSMECDISDINLHNSELKWHTSALDQLIFNPTKHFWHSRSKFLTPGALSEMKRKRNEPKDQKDLQLLETVK